MSKALVSFFNAPVSNTTNYENYSWKQLCKKCTEKPSLLIDNSGNEKAKNGAYFVRGIINGLGIRNDEGLEDSCYTIILDVDKEPLHPVDFIKKKLDETGLAYIVHSTATKGNSRIIILCKKYDKWHTENVTRALVRFLLNVGLPITWVSENKKLSQPWFTPQATIEHKDLHKAYCSNKGKKFDWKKEFAKAGIDVDARIAAAEESESENGSEISTHNRKAAWIDGLRSGTLHQVAVTYAGWKRKTSNLTVNQILDDMEVDVESHCDTDKIARWHDGEREGLEKWFKGNTESGYHKLELEGIEYTANQCPYLSDAIMFPEESAFGKIAQSIGYHQQARYNKYMAFWYSLAFIDYLIGGGYASIFSDRMDPNYVFTSGKTGDGKTITIQSGEKHLNAIKGINSIKGMDEIQREDSSGFTALLANKEKITRVGSAQGLEDLLVQKLEHGSDVLFTQDEAGLNEKGKIGNDAAAMMELKLILKTVGRFDPFNARILALNKDNKKRQKSKYCIHFNYFTTTTDSTLIGILRDDDFASGYLQRFVGGSSHIDGRPPTRKSIFGSKFCGAGIDDSVVALLKRILNVGFDVKGMDRMENAIVVNVETAAEEYHDDVEENLPDDVYFSKVPEVMLPLAKMRAVCSCPETPVVTESHMRWGHTVAVCSVYYFKWLVGELRGAGNVRMDVIFEDRLVKYMSRCCIGVDNAKSRRIITDNLRRRGEKITSVIRNRVWDSLIAEGIIIAAKGDTTSGRKREIYYTESAELAGRDGS